jgi:hypothetical protein
MENQTTDKPSAPRRCRGAKVARIIGMTIVGVIFAVLFALVFGLLVKVLWNWLMPVIFGLPEIGYWQAFGLVVLAKLLFGAFGHHRHDDPHDHFHRHFEAKWHRWMGLDEPKEWKHFHQFWQDEGQAAFEAYIERTKAQKQEKTTKPI